MMGAGTFALRQPDSLPDNLPLFIDTAAVLGHRSRDNLIGKFIPLLIQLIIPGQPCNLIQHSVLQTKQCRIVGNHEKPPYVPMS